jgi:anti-sigma B factor antagonist
VTVTVTTMPPHTVVAAAGELDLAMAPELRGCLHRLLDDGATDLVVDLTDASFVDSTILGVLVGAQQRLNRAGRRLTLVCSREAILRVLRLTSLDRVFVVRGSLEEVTGEDSYSSRSPG